jgi:iron complex outermembrane receptor protein
LRSALERIYISFYRDTDDLERYLAPACVQHLGTQTQRVDAASFHAVQPKMSLSYKLTPEAMVYATYAQGYKSGIFNTYNTVVGAIPLVVKPEKTNGFELGIKDALFSRHVLLTAAAFYTHYKNAQEYQLDIQSGGQATVNVNKSRIYGIEAQLQAQLVKGFELNMDFGYTNSRIQDFNGTPLYVGQRLPSTPLYTLNVGAQYTHALPVGNITGRADFSQFGRTVYQDFQNPDTNQVLTQLAYHTVNAQVAYGYKNYTLTVFGKNVLNEHYVNTAYSRYISQLIFGVTGDLIQPAVGATYGVELRAAF